MSCHPAVSPTHPFLSMLLSPPHIFNVSKQPQASPLVLHPKCNASALWQAICHVGYLHIYMYMYICFIRGQLPTTWLWGCPQYPEHFWFRRCPHLTIFEICSSQRARKNCVGTPAPQTPASELTIWNASWIVYVHVSKWDLIIRTLCECMCVSSGWCCSSRHGEACPCHTPGNTIQAWNVKR